MQKDDHYQQLQELVNVNNIPWDGIAIVIGDVNSQIGGDRSGFVKVLDSHVDGNFTEKATTSLTFAP